MITPKQQDRLIYLYKQISELTEPLCRACPVPQNCCSTEYCQLAKQGAMKEWGVLLVPVAKNARLPFMGPKGCIVPPHLRPLCAVHHCAINSVGFFPKQVEKTQKYFELREEIEMIELERE